LRFSQTMPHPNIVRYVDFFEDASYYYAVMDLIEGPELFEYLTCNFPVTEAYCREVMRQVFAALKQLHVRVGAYHRDVKFENFRYTKSGELVLLDFGFARMIGEPWDRSIVGTMTYVSPEIAATIALAKSEASAETMRADGGYSPAVDLWAAGVMLFVLFTGRIPFSDNEVQALSDISAAERAVAELMRDAELSSKSEAAVDLLRRLLIVDVSSRIDVSQALEHPCFQQTDASETQSVGVEKKPEFDSSRAQSGCAEVKDLLRTVSNLKINSTEVPYFGD